MNKTPFSWRAAWRRPPVLGASFGGLIVLGSILISSHGLFAFFSLEGLLIVGGGVVAVAYMSYDPFEVRLALSAIRALFQDEPKDDERLLLQDMRNIVDWAQIIREKNMRMLESMVSRAGMRDPFVKYGLNMVVSDYASSDIRAMMETAADANLERESVPVDVLDSMTSHAPAFGMVGTLVGMVAMLSQLKADNLAQIGAALSVAFLATLYGVLSARMIYMPAASKLRQQVEKRRFRLQLIVEGMVMLADKKPPMFIRDRLNSFLRVEKYEYFSVFDKDRTGQGNKAPYLKAVGL